MTNEQEYDLLLMRAIREMSGLLVDFVAIARNARDADLSVMSDALAEIERISSKGAMTLIKDIETARLRIGKPAPKRGFAAKKKE